MAVLSPEQAKTANLVVAVAAVAVTMEWVYADLFHNHPIIEAMEPVMGALAAVVAGILVFVQLKHKPLL